MIVEELPRFRARLLKKDLGEAYVLQIRNVWDTEAVLSNYIESTGAFSTYKNPEADRLIGEVRHAIDPEKIASLYQSLVQVLKEDALVIPLMRERQFHGVRGGWRPRANGLMLGSEIGR